MIADVSRAAGLRDARSATEVQRARRARRSDRKPRVASASDGASAALPASATQSQSNAAARGDASSRPQQRRQISDLRQRSAAQCGRPRARTSTRNKQRGRDGAPNVEASDQLSHQRLGSSSRVGLYTDRWHRRLQDLQTDLVVTVVTEFRRGGHSALLARRPARVAELEKD